MKAQIEALDFGNSGWHLLGDDERVDLEKELQRELSPGHLLFGKSITVVARHYDQDDILLLFDDQQLAGVHLTWKMKPEHAPWPNTWSYRNLQEFVQRELRPPAS